MFFRFHHPFRSWEPFGSTCVKWQVLREEADGIVEAVTAHFSPDQMLEGAARVPENLRDRVLAEALSLKKRLLSSLSSSC